MIPMQIETKALVAVEDLVVGSRSCPSMKNRMIPHRQARNVVVLGKRLEREEDRREVGLVMQGSMMQL